MDKKMSITLCDKVLIGDIPQYKFTNKEESKSLIHHWLEKKDFNKSVFVCFQNWRGLPNEDLRNEQSSFLVSHSWDDITGMVEDVIESTEIEDIDFAIFEYDSYEDAFRYCIDLKESF